MIKVANETIQAFPITERTYVGVASGYDMGGNVLHAAVDGDITFDFGTRGIITVTVTTNISPGSSATNC